MGESSAAHPYRHAHQSDRSHESHEWPAVRGGPPMLDIGGDVGAMVATMAPATAGREIHLRSEHDPPVSVHTGVWERALGDRTVTAAVFCELAEGAYWVLDGTGTPVHRVDITGGELTTVDLRQFRF
jgi:hypothetical protein